MRKTSRLFRVVGAAALLISMLAATIAPATAQDDGLSQDWLDVLIDADGVGFLDGNNAIYYPWVANDDDFGLGAADTSISVQNLEDRDTTISIFVGNGAGGFDLATTAYLSAYAAKTFHAAQLGIAEGDGAPVAVVSFNTASFTSIPGFVTPAGTLALVETSIILSNPVADDEDDGENDGGDTTQALACVVNYHLTSQPNLGVPYGYVAVYDHVFNGVAYEAGEWVSFAGVDNVQAALQDALNDVNDGNLDELINPFGGINADGDCFDVLDAVTLTLNNGVAIGGVAKQAVDGEALPSTSSADTAVSGYNALNGIEIAYFDEWYLPIVQTNCGPGGCWDSMLRVANLDSLNNAVTIRFFPADDGSGSLNTGFQLNGMVNGGDTWHVNLGDYVPDGWVGSAHIYSDGAVFAMVDRYKVGYNMWITNTGSSADFENIAQVPGVGSNYVLFAPHVLMDYFGWNTGINVANLVNTDNHISIQYFNMFGNATQVLSQRLAAHGMTYFYDPSIAAQDNNSQDVTNDPNAGVVGSALIWSDYPVAAAIDATKYPETDPNGGADLFQATSYSATANVFPWQAIPLIQKGNPIDGMGDTSGINIMNPNAVAATATVYWVNPSGFLASNFGPGSVTIPGFANGFVYTLWQHNLPNGFLGAAQVVSNVPVAAVSANVNYEVDGDGSAIFNAFNPCGLYRVSGPCTFGDVFAPGGQSVTKYFVVDDEDGVVEDGIDDDDIGIAGVNFSIVSTSGAGYQRDGVSGTDGSMTFTNVPVGTYDLFVSSVPGMFIAPGATVAVDSFVVGEGQDVVLINELEYAQGINKTVVVAGSLGDDDEIDDDTVTLSGVNVSIYENIGTTAMGGAVAGDLVFTGTTDADGMITDALPPGNYILCTWDEDGEAVTSNGETVDVDLIATGGYGDLGSFCELVTVATGVYSDVINEVDLEDGILNVFIFTLEPTDVGGVDEQVGVAGVEVCLLETAECAFTNADGFVKFLDLPEGSYTVEVQADGYIVVNVDGGTTNVSNPIFIEDGASVTPAVVTFDYDPTADVAQDGWMDDVAPDGTPRGQFDLEIEVDESDAQLIEKTVQINGENVGEGEGFVEVIDSGTDEVVASGTTDPDGVASFVVDPGTYDICSTVDIDTGQGQIFEYTLCEADEAIVVTDPAIIYEYTNNHETGTITKNVNVLESCPVGVVIDDPATQCTFVPAADGTEVTADTSLLTESELFSGTYATAGGSVTLTLPVSADVGDYEICSTVGVDEICETVTITVDPNADLDNNHVVGQLDVGWDGTFPTDLTYPDDATYCLFAEGVAPTVGNEIECVTVPAGSPYAGDAGIYFTNIPAGNYFITFDEGTWGSGQSPNSAAYDPIVDAQIDGDVVDVAGANGYGTLIPGQTFDLLFTEGGMLISGYPDPFLIESTGALQNEVQTFTKVNPAATGGAQSIQVCYDVPGNCVTVDVSGSVTAAANNGGPSDFNDMLPTLTGIGAGNVVAVANEPNQVVATFQNGLAGVDVPQFTVDSTGAATVWTVDTTVEGGSSPEQTLSIASYVATGTQFTLTYDGVTTGPLTVGTSTAGDIETALELLPGITDVTVVGDANAGNSIVITFVNPATPAENIQVTAVP